MMKKKFNIVGIPQVPLKIPGQSLPQWIDLYSRLYIERILFLFRIFDDDFINQIIGMLLYLNMESKKKPIYLYLNSNGGSINSGIALYDIIKYLNVNIISACMGFTASIASFILTTGTLKKRLALPHSRILLHQPETELYGQASDLLLASEELIRVRRIIAKIYVEHTSQCLTRIARDLDRNSFLSAREAKNYGIIDHIICK